MAVAYGLPEQVALEAVTISAARILQIDDRVGTLTPGKIANVIVCDGSPLQPTTCYQGIFVAGRAYLPESRQTRLYDRYLGRLQEVRTKPAAAGAEPSPAAKESTGGTGIRPGGS
jgi:adenine deaminase